MKNQIEDGERFKYLGEDLRTLLVWFGYILSCLCSQKIKIEGRKEGSDFPFSFTRVDVKFVITRVCV